MLGNIIKPVIRIMTSGKGENNSRTEYKSIKTKKNWESDYLQRYIISLFEFCDVIDH